MAAIVNDRNELFSGAIQRLDSAEVDITSSVGNLSIASGATATPLTRRRSSRGSRFSNGAAANCRV